MAERKKISNALLFGGIAAVVMILFVFGTYRGGPRVFLSWFVWLGRAIVVVLAVVAAVREKRAHGGLLDFRVALKVSFGVMVLAIIGQTLFAWLLLNVIDPHFRQTLMPMVLQKIETTSRNFRVPEEEIRRELDAERGQDQFTLGRMLSGMGWLIIFHFVISLVIAGAVGSKKRRTI